MGGLGRGRPPTERGVAGDQYRRNGIGIESCECSADYLAGFEFVLASNLGVRQARSYRNWAVKVVGVSGSKARNWRFGLSPCGGVLRVGVSYPADIGKLSVQLKMGREIRRGSHLGVNDGPF